MKQKYPYYILLFILSGFSAQAQIQIQNGGFELWSGIDIPHPDNWTTLEQAIGLKTNRWTFRETMPESMHSGLNAVRLKQFQNGVPSKPATFGMQSGGAPGRYSYGRASSLMAGRNTSITRSRAPVYLSMAGLSL